MYWAIKLPEEQRNELKKMIKPSITVEDRWWAGPLWLTPLQDFSHITLVLISVLFGSIEQDRQSQQLKSIDRLWCQWWSVLKTLVQECWRRLDHFKLAYYHRIINKHLQLKRKSGVREISITLQHAQIQNLVILYYSTIQWTSMHYG